MCRIESGLLIIIMVLGSLAVLALLDLQTEHLANGGQFDESANADIPFVWTSSTNSSGVSKNRYLGDHTDLFGYLLQWKRKNRKMGSRQLSAPQPAASSSGAVPRAVEKHTATRTASSVQDAEDPSPVRESTEDGAEPSRGHSDNHDDAAVSAVSEQEPVVVHAEGAAPQPNAQDTPQQPTVSGETNVSASTLATESAPRPPQRDDDNQSRNAAPPIAKSKEELAELIYRTKALLVAAVARDDVDAAAAAALEWKTLVRATH